MRRVLQTIQGGAHMTVEEVLANAEEVYNKNAD